METKNLVQNALSGNFSEFDANTKDMLSQKVAAKLAEQGYFDRMDRALGLLEGEETCSEWAEGQVGSGSGNGAHPGHHEYQKQLAKCKEKRKKMSEARKLTDQESAKVKDCQKKCAGGERPEMGTPAYDKYAECVKKCKAKILG